MQAELFEAAPREVALAPGAVVLVGFARPAEAALLAAIESVGAAAPFRHMLTPGGRRMSVVGWGSTRRAANPHPGPPPSGGGRIAKT